MYLFDSVRKEAWHRTPQGSSSGFVGVESFRDKGDYLEDQEISREDGIQANQFGSASRSTKNRSNRKKYIFISVVIIILVGLSLAVLFLYPSKPDVEIKSITLGVVEWDDMILRKLPSDLHIEMDITVTNDNVLGATVDQVKGKAYLSDNNSPGDNDYIGDFSVEKPFTVPGNSKVDVTVDFHLRDLPSPTKVGKIIKDGNIFIRTAGNVYLSLSFIDFSVSFDETESVEV